MARVSLPRIRLQSGVWLPVVGMGTWPMNNVATHRAVASGLDLGHRLVDTAAAFGNETGVGWAVRASHVPREEIVVVTKLRRDRHRRALVGRALRESIAQLGDGQVDLLMVHWPNPADGRYVDAWRGLVALRDAGAVGAIGTSNFSPAHLSRLIEETGVVPEVNQIKLNPYLPRDLERAFHREHNIVTQSWSPLGGPGAPILHESVVCDIAQAHGRTPAQVVLRWHIDLGSAPVVKSADPSHQRENLELFDFTLEADEIAALAALERGAAPALDNGGVSR